MILDFSIILIAMLLGALGGIYLGMRIQTPRHNRINNPNNNKDDSHHYEELLPSATEEKQASEDNMPQNVETIPSETSPEQNVSQELRSKMRGQDARYCILKQD